MERCGGVCLAFSEINNDAIQTYIANHPESLHSNLGDITALRDLPPHDLLTGGVPCQSWSIAGKNLGFDDDRGQLWNDAIYLLNKSKPKAFIFENVKGLIDPRNKKALDYILTQIKMAGYFAQIYVLNSFDYGVPQSRVRIYIIGFREERFFRKFKIPTPTSKKMTLRDILDDAVESHKENGIDEGKVEFDLFGEPLKETRQGFTSLSTNNNGFNDYFLFNDLRNGETTIHSWDILPTTDRQKHICMLLLRNRRKSTYGHLDGNPLSLQHFMELDPSITQHDLDELTELGILKPEDYSFIIHFHSSIELTQDEEFILSLHRENIITPDHFSKSKDLKLRKINFKSILANLQKRKMISSLETRYDFKNTKISTGLFGINRVFLPSSNIFPTLVASDTNDYVTPVSLHATNGKAYKHQFLNTVFHEKNYRRISKQEACRIQGFPPNFILPTPRARWMKLLGNSVSIPVIEHIIGAVTETGVFSE